MRRTVGKKARFVPLAFKDWQSKFLVAPTGFYGLEPQGETNPNSRVPGKRSSIPGTGLSNYASVPAVPFSTKQPVDQPKAPTDAARAGTRTDPN